MGITVCCDSPSKCNETLGVTLQKLDHSDSKLRFEIVVFIEEDMW